MWENVDKELKNYEKTYKKEQTNTIDEFQNLFDGVKDLDEYANKNDIGRFQRKIEQNKEYLSEYGLYLANKYQRRNRIKYSDILWFNIFMLYAYEQYVLYKSEYKIIDKLGKETYLKEIKDLEKAKVVVKKNYNLDKYIEDIVNSNNSKGYIWKDYKTAMTEYNTNELYRQVIQNVRENKKLDVSSLEFKKIFDKQRNRIISVNGNKTSGALDNEVIYAVNSMKIKAYTDNKIVKCMFVADIDEKTTKMCKSLNHQVFNLQDWNEFERYSATNMTKRKYKVYGMIPGVNLPPIDDHYHWCRSTITYMIGDE